MDGVKNGIIANIYNARMNRESFAKHIKEKYHLTGAQMNTIKVYEEGFSLDYAMASGVRKYQGCCALEGGLMDLGPDPIPREPLDTRYNVHHGDRADCTTVSGVREKVWTGLCG